MLLTRHNVTHYLLDRGLITLESLVDGDVMVMDVSRRNRNFKVVRKNSPGYFVKQIQNWDPFDITALEREATCYRLAQDDVDFAPLAVLMPKCHLYDAMRHAIVVELLPDGEDLFEYHRRLGKFPIDVACRLGQVLGTYHQQMEMNWNHQSSVFPQMVPWILSIHQQNASPSNAPSAAHSQLLGILQKNPGFQQRLDTLRHQWQINSLIHGDIRWENCILHGEPDQEDKLHLKIVDWELSDFGDAYWDVGAVFQAYLSFWIMSLPIGQETSPQQFIDEARCPLEEMQPAIRAFWKAYTDKRQVEERAARELLERSVSYGAARMIQTVYEHAAYSPQLSAHAFASLQVSLNMLAKPQAAIGDLLGM